MKNVTATVLFSGNDYHYSVRVLARPWLFLGQVDYTLQIIYRDSVIFERSMKGFSKQSVHRAVRKMFNRNTSLLWNQYPWA